MTDERPVAMSQPAADAPAPPIAAPDRIVPGQTALLEALPDEAAIVDRTGRIRAVNAAWRAFGRDNGLQTPDAGIGINYLQIARDAAVRDGSQVAAEVAEGLDAVLSGRRDSLSVTYPCHGPEERRWFTVFVQPLATPTMAGALLLHRNITRRVTAEQRLGAWDERFFRTLDAVPVPLSVTHRDTGTVYFANAALGGFLGLDPRALEGRSILSAYRDPEARSRFVADLTANDGAVDQFEVDLTCDDGTVVPVALSARSMALGDADACLVITVYFDLRRRRRIEESLRESEREHRQRHKMEALGTLAGGIAHDFNNVLHPILMLAEDAMEDARDRPALYDTIDGIRGGAERAAALIQKILAFSREETSTAATCDLTVATGNTLRLLADTLPTSLALSTDLDSAAMPVPLLASDIDRIVLNLVTNARDAMAGKGRITVTTRRTELDHVLAPFADRLSPGMYAQLTVIDDGPGMPPATRERVFDPFFTTKPVDQGSGMGLAVIHGIVTTHGGAILVDSAPGAGTRFDLFLPLTQTPEDGGSDRA